MMAICPAGPPKLIKPSLSQYKNACLRLMDGIKGNGGFVILMQKINTKV
jgi:hypothetical protein